MSGARRLIRGSGLKVGVANGYVSLALLNSAGSWVILRPSVLTQAISGATVVVTQPGSTSSMASVQKIESVTECSVLPDWLFAVMDCHTQDALRFLARLAAAGTGLPQVRVPSIGNPWGSTRELADLYRLGRPANRAAHALRPPRRLMKSGSGSSGSLYAAGLTHGLSAQR